MEEKFLTLGFDAKGSFAEEKEPTQHLTPFETTVLQRFDQIDARLDKLEAKAIYSKPIWERALAEILEVKDRVNNLERVLIRSLADLHEHDGRIAALEEAKP